MKVIILIKLDSKVCLKYNLFIFFWDFARNQLQTIIYINY